MYQRFFLLTVLLALPMPLWSAQEPVERSQAYYHFILGLMKERTQDLSAAIDQYREALQYDPKATEIFARLADLYVQTNRVPEAVKDAQSTLAKNPDDKEAHRMLGQIYLEKMYGGESNPQDLTNAIQEFQAVHRIDPKDEGAMLSLGQLYLQANQPQAAADVLSKYLETNPDVQTAIMAIASAYQQLNQPEKAISYLLKYSELNPNNIYVIQQIADSYMKAGNISAALEYQRRAFEGDTDNPTLARKYIDLLGKAAQYDEAVALLEARVSNEPDKLEWIVLLAKTYQKWGKQEQAESLITSKTATNPKDVDLSLALVQIYEEGQKFKDALRELERILQQVQNEPASDDTERKSNLALIYSHMGFTAQQMKDYERSNEFYEKARGFVDSADTGKLDFYIALNYRGQKKWDQAITLLQNVVRANPADTDALELISLVYEEKGDLANSDKIIEQLISAYPNSIQYALLKAERLQRREQYEQSISYLKEVAPRFPADDRALFLLGAAAERLKKYDEAEAFFKQVLSVNPRNADAYNYLGYMLIDTGSRVQEGLNYVKQALEIDRNNGAYLDSLGWGYFRLNQLDLAEDNLRQALEKLSDNAVVHEHMGDLYFKQGKFQMAVQHWEKALENKTNEIDPELIQKKIDDTKTRMR
jgi:tetratricopeptide (TPR) repeat protein